MNRLYRAYHKKGTGFEASQIRNFNDTPVTFSGYHPDIMEFCLLSNTEVVTSYFVYNLLWHHRVVLAIIILSTKNDIFRYVYYRWFKNVPSLVVFKDTRCTKNTTCLSMAVKKNSVAFYQYPTWRFLCSGPPKTETMQPCHPKVSRWTLTLVLLLCPY